METWLLLTTYRTYQRPILRYHRRPPTTYRLATIPHDFILPLDTSYLAQTVEMELVQSSVKRPSAL